MAAHQWRRSVSRVAALDAQCVEYREYVVEADQVAPGERPARVVHTQLHARVDVRRRADALARGERRLVDELADDPAQHEPRRVANPGRVDAQRRKELLTALGRKLARPAAARQLHEPAGSERRQRVETGSRPAAVERCE